MAKYKIDHDRPGCIGCGACAAVAPDFWEMKEDGKSSIIGGAHVGDREILEIEEVNFKKNKEAADSCPVNVIHLIGPDGKKII